jgi:hypothetical protein
MKLWQLGLLVFVVSGAVNAFFVNSDIGGLPRELARLSIFVGLIILIVGVFKRNHGK